MRALAAALSALLACMLASCSDDTTTYDSVADGIRNNSDHTITVHYDDLQYDIFLSESLVQRDQDIPPRTETTIVIYYQVLPEFRVTGPGYDRTFSGFSYQGSHLLVIMNSDLIVANN